VRLLALALTASVIAGPGLAQTKTVPPKSQPTKSASSKGQAAKAPAAVPKDAPRTTLSGVYTLAEARAGKDMYASLCASCHTAASHTGVVFRSKWAGLPLADLYTYIRTLMPKNDPGSLADEEYAVLLAYMLQMNKMPAGKVALSTDSSELAKIRIDTAKTVGIKKP
jgi:mono/diheme cytochrome c family protein